jgi:hypothetical protein
MKYLKKFEKWSSKFNRTLQGAAALATSTNKPDQKKQSIEDYANRSISKEEFMFKAYKKVNGNWVEINSNVLTIVHDPKFILKPIELLKVDHTSVLSIPVLLKYKKEDGTIVHEPHMLTFTEDGSIYINSSKDWKWDVKFPGYKIRFVNRASIENFIAMAIQAITSSPEPGTPVESASTRITNRRMNLPEFSGMTKEKQAILDLIQKIVLDKDMRSFTI